jgi:ribonucleoside-diphosphate reductase alpha chain
MSKTAMSTKSTTLKGLVIERRFSSPGTHPFDEVEWETRDAVIGDPAKPAFKQEGVEFPKSWSQNATNIVAQKYFRGQLGSEERERSVKQMVGRVAGRIAEAGREAGYFASVEDGDAFEAELASILVNQRAAFNSPVWFNVGWRKPGQEQASACFILSVEDTMESILDWNTKEGLIFKGGSGSGVNLSKIRGSMEPLAKGGIASGPVSFMRGADSWAGAIKSGGGTRRAAKMVVLNVDHPDIEDFIWCKAREEEKAATLLEAGYDMRLDSEAFASVQYQNANNSVRVTDEFMEAVEANEDWDLIARTTGEPIKTLPARELMNEIADAAWRCADPGVQYDSTIQRWHTDPNTGPITASNPCSEYLSIDDSACNLASLNLMKFRNEDGTFNIDDFTHAVDIVFLAQEIVVGFSSYPTEQITENANRFRQLGLGYANLGALLMSDGVPYDSDEGRNVAAAITALMTGRAYRKSAEIAGVLGPYDGYEENREPHNGVMRMHRDAAHDADPAGIRGELLDAAKKEWDAAVELGEEHGYRNAQATVLAPTGCLVGDSLISTSRGLVRLNTLGDTCGPKWQGLDIEVATDEGPRQATDFYVNGFEQVVSIETGRGYRIQGTPTHRIKVVDAEGQWVWRRFAEIEKGDRVPMMMNGMVGEPQEVPLPPLGELHWNADFRTRVPQAVTADLAELVGYFMGDGSLHAKGIRLCVDAKDRDVVDRLVELGTELFGISPKVSEQKGYTEVAYHSVPLTMWWEACGFSKLPPSAEHSGKGWHAHVPDAILHSNDPDVYAAFIRGLWEADGTTSNGYASWSTITERFSRDVQSLMLALGFVTTRKIDGTDSNWGAHERYVLRILNVSEATRFAEEIGFISDRKSESLCVGEHRQASRHDHIPVSRELIDELAPENDSLRKTMLMALSRRGDVSRRSATALLERTESPELEHLLDFFYDEVAEIEVLDDQPTFDLSVPDNVTYVANGFVSHNTISFLMDCDTTGIEPDFSLVKFKELVGGGQMTIVNRSVPLALRTLGYSDAEVDQIDAHIAEKGTIIGAPGLKDEHLPVFDVAVGERAISHTGHIDMMAATQPFISGAISKTVNLPESATVEDIADAYTRGWKGGLKALAIYRDGSKTAQALRTDAQKEKKAPEEAEAPPPVRKKMPRERESITHKFSIAGHEGYITAGKYEDESVGEIFLTDIGKEGSTMRGLMNAFATAISIGLQYGVPLETFVRKFSYMRFEPEGMTGNPEIPFAKSLPDYIMRWLASRFIEETEVLEDLGILTEEVRAKRDAETSQLGLGISTGDEVKPGNGGNGHSKGNGAEKAKATGGEAVPAAEALTETPPVRPAKMSGLELGPACEQCGGMMQRTGSCYTCSSCGNNTGCG